MEVDMLGKRSAQGSMSPQAENHVLAEGEGWCLLVSTAE